MSSIQDRKVSRNSVGNDAKIGNINDDKNSIAKKEAFQKAWDETHTMFREKMMKKEATSDGTPHGRIHTAELCTA